MNWCNPDPKQSKTQLAEGKNISGEYEVETPLNLTSFFPEQNPQGIEN